MSPNLESFHPKLRPGRVIPQGSRIIFETDNPYNQIILPMALADMILLCSGQFSMRDIVEKIYRKQGAVPFKAILTAIHLLHQGGFLENGDQLVLSSHLQSWAKPRRNHWAVSWRFGQRIIADHRLPGAYYAITLGVLLTSIVGLQMIPTSLVTVIAGMAQHQSGVETLIEFVVCSSILQTLRYTICGLQTLLLTAKAYNVSLRLSPWGIYLHVGDEANDLFENRLYASMFHVSQMIVCWGLVFVGSWFLPPDWLENAIIVSLAITVWELNPFRNSECRKLIRTLMIASDHDVSAWHFDAKGLVGSINPASSRQNRSFAKVCSLWGAFWLGMNLVFMQRVTAALGPTVLARLTHPTVDSVIPAAWLLFWFFALYYMVQCLIETLFVSTIEPFWKPLLLRLKRGPVHSAKPRAVADVIKEIEGLPVFSHFQENNLEEIIKRSQVLEYRAGATIIMQGDPSRDLYVLLEGEVEIVRRSLQGSTWVISLGKGSVFGEAALVDETPRAANVIAKNSVTTLRVPIQVLRQAALESQTVRHLEVFRNAIMVNQYFASSPIFRSLSSASVDFLCSRGTLEYFDQQQAVFKQGDTGDYIFLILRGSVDVEVHGQKVKRLEQGSFFGEISLIANIPRTATVRSTQPSVFFKISSDAFWEVLVQHMDLGVFIESVSEGRLREDLAVVEPQIKSTGTDSK